VSRCAGVAGGNERFDRLDGVLVFGQIQHLTVTTR
jgi:hypothetical protein